jgi:hypothetical protein
MAYFITSSASASIEQIFSTPTGIVSASVTYNNNPINIDNFNQLTKGTYPLPVDGRQYYKYSISFVNNGEQINWLYNTTASRDSDYILLENKNTHITDVPLFPYNGVAVITGSLIVSGGYVNLSNTSVISGPFSVGTSTHEAESLFGGGNFTTSEMIVLASGSNIGWQNYTISASTATGSVFYVPSGSGDSLYIGNSIKFYGIKANVVTERIGSSSFWEYYDGGKWTSMSIMRTDADYPYSQSAQNVFSSSLINEQIRYSPSIGNNWTQTTVSSSNAYWIRYINSGSNSYGGSLEKIELHTNSTKINQDGFIEYFGKSEPQKMILEHQNLTNILSGSSPSNSTIVFSPNISIDFINNRYINNNVDGRTGIITIPKSLDTSRSIIFNIYWMPDSNGSPSNVELEINIVNIKQGQTISGMASETRKASITTVGTSDINVLKKTAFTINPKDLVDGDFLVISLFRDGTAGNADDTFTGNVDIIKLDMVGYFWS